VPWSSDTEFVYKKTERLKRKTERLEKTEKRTELLTLHMSTSFKSRAATHSFNKKVAIDFSESFKMQTRCIWRYY